MPDRITYQNSRMIGNIGESEAIAEFVKRGIPIFTPFGQNSPVDLVAYINNHFIKIQVKTTENATNGVMKFNIDRTNGFTKKHIPYSKKEVDYFFLYCIENDYKGLISYEDLKSGTQFRLRYSKTKINQIKGVNFADEYRFDKKIEGIMRTG